MAQRIISFQVSDEDFKRGKNIPRSYKVSEMLREAYKKILKQCGV